MTPPLPLEALPDVDVREEWEHFRGFGWSDQRIATRLGIQWDTVCHWVSRYHQRGRAVRPSASKRRARVEALIKQGWSHQDVADALGISRHTVHDDCCRLGITRRTA